MNMEKISSPGEKKVAEYVDRIRRGESKDSVTDGLPQSFVDSIESELGNLENIDDEAGSSLKSQERDLIPPQYQGLGSDALDFAWTISLYTDPEKTKKEQERKAKALEFLRKKESDENESKIRELKRREELKKVKKELGMEDERTEYEGIEDQDYKDFSIKRGETDQGVFWNEYRNVAAKKLKESGEFEWGKERIYFDIKLDDFETLRDMIMNISKEKKIPVAFKYLDTENTGNINLKPESEITRFVANFASTEDAKLLYYELVKLEEYNRLTSDRNLDHNGYNIDGVAHYASGYREIRSALKSKIDSATENPDGTYDYIAIVEDYDGSKIEVEKTMTAEMLADFKRQYEDLPDPEEVWNS